MPQYDRLLRRLPIIAALAAALALTACGRKGSLDPPPSASLAGEQEANKPDIMSNPLAAPIGGQAKDGNPGVSPDGRVQAPKGQKKQIPLDVLLN